jgi:transcriptional regulator with XRE-family HTH domain
MLNRRHFGPHLIALREQGELTQAELARLISVDRRQVWRWEHGHRIPRYEALGKIALALEISVDELVGLG